MKVSFRWLKEYIDVNLSPLEIANRLTMAGNEVGGMRVIGGNWENVVVGEILAINPHPNADRLSLPTVDIGAEQCFVVCGAPNLKVGDKIAFARVGAQLIDGHSGQLVRLKPAKIRGVVSSGMVCSEKELGISDNHEGIMVLSPEVKVGTPLIDFMGDVIFDLEVTLNRPDCLSVIGIAREAAALTGQPLHLPEVSYEATALPIDRQVSVSIEASDLCPRYCASLIKGVKLGPSPNWMQQRLLACGMRPISNIVDITNYVMLEYGQPLHVFDYERISGRKIIVRRANDGERLVTLDGVERQLDSDMLVIADEDRAVALAGVMGGVDSEVTPQTTSILLEAASFNPASIHFTGSTLRLPSEACMRFERGISPELTLSALERATQLMLQLGGGEAAEGFIDVYPGKVEPEAILLSTDKIEKLLGVSFRRDQIVAALSALGFECELSDSEAGVLAVAPYWRTDIHQAVDLVEEVARVIGYDKVPMTLLSQPLPRQSPEPMVGLKQAIRQGLVGYGFQEIISFSLVSREMLEKMLPEPQPLEPAPIHLANPMTADHEYLRSSLRPNLLVALEANRRHEDGSIMFFELAKIYLPCQNELPYEPEIMCVILSGSRAGKSWQCGDESPDFYMAKGVVEGLLRQLGIEAEFDQGNDKSLHPDRQTAVVVDGNRVGVVGELHPKVLAAFDIDEPVYLCEIDLNGLLPTTLGYKMFQPILRFPEVVKDIALIVDDGVTHREIQDIIKGFDLVRQVAIFDVYTGDQVPPGKKSLAYRLTFQSPTHTLTDKEVGKVQQQILDTLSTKLGATLRN
ncbi:phenylalanine--tRNA ligase subunit beta [Chloroflexota bacterium]